MMASAHWAARRNDVERLASLLDEEPELLEADGEWTSSRPLHAACSAASMEAAGLLLDRGADINCQDKDGVTALMRASEAGHLEMVSFLLAHGADPAISSSVGWTALTYASYYCCRKRQENVKYLPVIRCLLKDGRVPVDARTNDGWTALWLACMRGHIDRARVLLLEGRADHTVSDVYGATLVNTAKQSYSPAFSRLFEWFEGELEKAFLLSKARAVVDATESISKAPEKVEAKTEAEAQRAREEAAPAWVRGRVRRNEALPSVELVKQEGGAEREKCEAVCDFVLMHLKEDLAWELMEALWCFYYRRLVPDVEEEN